MIHYLLELTTLDMNQKKYLQEIKTKITYAYAKGKINDSHYKLLNEKITELENTKNNKDIDKK